MFAFCSPMQFSIIPGSVSSFGGSRLAIDELKPIAFNVKFPHDPDAACCSKPLEKEIHETKSLPHAGNSFPVHLILLQARNRKPGTAVAFALPHPPSDAATRTAPDSCPITLSPAHLMPRKPAIAVLVWYLKAVDSFAQGWNLEGLQHYSPSDIAFRQKLFWFREGWRIEMHPKLEVTGKRLDAQAPPLDAAISNGWTNDSTPSW
jgi:hypothetical protein